MISGLFYEPIFPRDMLFLHQEEPNEDGLGARWS